MNVHLSPGSLERVAPLTSGASAQTAAATRAAAAQMPEASATPQARKAERYRGEGLNARIAFVAQQADFNQRVTGAQRTKVFLEQTLTHLQALKKALGVSIAGAPDRAAVASRLAAFDTHWQTRASATAGVLDSDLGYHEDHGARQPFQMRALEWPMVNHRGAETLTLYPGGLSKTPVTLSFDAAPEAEEALVRRIDRALAPAGIRVALKDRQDLVFSTAEVEWPEVRDQMMIQGGGKRFPGGRPSRAATTALPGAIEPQNWSIGDRSAQRDTLRQVVRALEQVGQAQAQMNVLLEEASVSIQAGLRAGVDGRGGADAFAQALEQPTGFQVLAAIGSSLKGMSRSRVNVLLKAR
ncbi:hypothetical protein [Paraburkholderia hayleyella]|uniref:hypothetical protein n=1 Tax=Paraburkholderia hayleyella TaxID=2152889 RepID=UPI0012909FC1|nr:hypothetical protein [Paraburkholderia hayleyella]